MPRQPASQRRLTVLAMRICHAVVDLTRHRTGRGRRWVMLQAIEERLGDVPADELQEALARAVESGVLMARGDPVHSIALHRQHLSRIDAGFRRSLTAAASAPGSAGRRDRRR